MKVMQELVAYFDSRGKLSRRQMKKLLEQSYIASDAPNNMHGLCDTVGAVYYFRITGAAEGQVWGTDTYTRDSSLGAAAVHAGLVKPEAKAVVRVTVVAPLTTPTFPTPGRCPRSDLVDGLKRSDYGASGACGVIPPHASKPAGKPGEVDAS
jgi:hypothetical protein